jgi:hypothetical protein
MDGEVGRIKCRLKAKKLSSLIHISKSLKRFECSVIYLRPKLHRRRLIIAYTVDLAVNGPSRELHNKKACVGLQSAVFRPYSPADASEALA